ncbi:MAG: CRP-like cAMP-binding protein [Saprospiraceae bacterium]|jgi:CRP-like cAMP-binding protein
MNPIEVIINEIESHSLWEKELTLKRNEFLKVKGSTDTSLYYIVDGSLRIFIEEEYEEHTIRFGYTGELITALDSFIRETPSDLYIQALKKTSLKVISKQAYLSFINSTEAFKEQWMKVLEGFVYQQMQRERDLLTSSPKERYSRVLERSPHLFQVIPNKYIAAYLRMTPETLSRLKKS